MHRGRMPEQRPPNGDRDYPRTWHSIRQVCARYGRADTIGTVLHDARGLPTGTVETRPLAQVRVGTRFRASNVRRVNDGRDSFRPKIR